MTAAWSQVNGTGTVKNELEQSEQLSTHDSAGQRLSSELSASGTVLTSQVGLYRDFARSAYRLDGQRQRRPALQLTLTAC